LRRKAPRRRLCPVKTAHKQGGKAALPARGKGFWAKSAVFARAALLRRILAVDIAYFCGGIGFIAINIIYLERIGRSGVYTRLRFCLRRRGISAGARR